MKHSERDQESLRLALYVNALLDQLAPIDLEGLYEGLKDIYQETGSMDFPLVQRILRARQSPLRLIALKLQNPIETRAISPITQEWVGYELSVALQDDTEEVLDLQLRHYYNTTLRESDSNLQHAGFLHILPGTQAALQQKARLN